MTEPERRYKRPESVLVVVYTRDGKVLLLKRSDLPDFWQSVTGAMRWDEQDPQLTAVRELAEESGVRIAPDALLDLDLTQRFAILPQLRHRYAPDVAENVEHAFAVELPRERMPRLSSEHTAYGWFSFDEALSKAASWSNREAIRRVAAMFASTPPAPARDEDAAVVLVHGMWMQGWSMGLLARRLRRAGFRTHCISYPSRRTGLRDNAARLNVFLAALPYRNVHLVGHSLGCVVIRTLLQQFPWQVPGRIVMLAPPHQGSLAARQLAKRRLGRWMLGKSGTDLAHIEAGERTLPACEIGIVSGTVSLGLGRLFAPLSSPNDGVITVAETMLPGVSASLTLRVAHSGMLISPRVAAAVAHFLAHGRFP